MSDPHTVELPLDVARAIRRAAIDGTAVGLRDALEPLFDAIETAEEISPVFEGLRRGSELEDDWRGPPPGLRRDGAPQPRWDYLRKAIVRIEALVRDDPGALAKADALGAYVRETWDALGLSLYDHETLYVAITTASLLVEMAENGRTKFKPVVDTDTVVAIANIAQSFTAAVMAYLPKEARG